MKRRKKEGKEKDKTKKGNRIKKYIYGETGIY